MAAEICFLVTRIFTDDTPSKVEAVYLEIPAVERDYPQFNGGKPFNTQHVNVGNRCFVITPVKFKK